MTAIDTRPHWIVDHADLENPDKVVTIYGPPGDTPGDVGQYFGRTQAMRFAYGLSRRKAFEDESVYAIKCEYNEETGRFDTVGSILYANGSRVVDAGDVT